ncbi:hypothetical protein L6164_002720 [Bauhinia variegata]|uniref:Uncharacterized protein n=1 Tax=Bauhinia variegata TaxID=167791 RepID=A0ACB9PZ79_BAUVA|nr:hypothetical protein L6164_002720 [Bauhinia variegata]
MFLSPARLGADVVIHSISKFIPGGSDIIAGHSFGSERKHNVSGVTLTCQGPQCPLPSKSSNVDMVLD